MTMKRFKPYTKILKTYIKIINKLFIISFKTSNIISNELYMSTDVFFPPQILFTCVEVQTKYA